VSAAVSNETAADNTDKETDYLFTWKPNRWPHSELRKLVDAFETRGFVEDDWRCLAYRKIRPGARAYMLKQGRPIGIFGIGQVSGGAEKNRIVSPGENPWHVPIRFDASLGDVLWDPEERLLVPETQLSQMPVSKSQWRIQASGVRLESTAARAIDNITFDSLRIAGRPAFGLDNEIFRQRRLLELATRPNQQAFREQIRSNYGGRCAVTGCTTPAAFEAAHISTCKGRDDNSPTNGILLRSDIHALFDRLLITLSADVTTIDVSPELDDPSYAFLRTAAVARPAEAPPSKEHIQAHRNLFLERRKKHSNTFD
jgi:hypothetical protein